MNEKKRHGLAATSSERADRRGVKRWMARALAMVLGLALSLLVLEGVLRAAGLFVEGSRAGAAGDAGILCQGDSFTFGLFLPPESAYPARLEQLLHANGDPGARVVNAGIPSKPTWILKKELRSDLQRWKPRVVLLLAGINDHWRMRPEDHQVEVHGPARRPWRIVKTWQWLVAHFGGAREAQAPAPLQTTVASDETPQEPPVEIPDDEITNWIPTTAVTARPGAQEVRFRDRHGGMRTFDILAGRPEVDEFCAWIEEDMTTAVQIAREEGVVPVLLAYPASGGHFDPINAALERVARRTDTLFVDSRPEFGRGLREVGRGALFFPDKHATDVGCDVMARVALRELADAGLVRVERVPPALEALEGWTEPELAVAPEPGPPGERTSHMRVEYAPGYGAVLFLARARGETLVDYKGLGDVKRVESEGQRTRRLPLAADGLLSATLAGNQFRTVTLGADGTGLLPIPWDDVAATRAASGPDEVLFAAVAIVLPKVGPVLAVSGVIELVP